MTSPAVAVFTPTPPKAGPPSTSGSPPSSSHMPRPKPGTRPSHAPVVGPPSGKPSPSEPISPAPGNDGRRSVNPCTTGSTPSSTRPWCSSRG
jgi:hypothetical protein